MSLAPTSSTSGYVIDARGIKGPISLPPALNLQQQLSLMPAPFSARRDGQPREIPLPPTTASQSSSKRLSGSVSNSGNTSSNNSNTKTFKDSRKILGKTLHAAGVALIMSTNSSDNITGTQDGGGELTVSSSPSVKHNHGIDANLTGSVPAGDGEYSIAYEGAFRQKPLPFPMKQPSASNSIPSDGVASTVETISTALNSSSLVNIEDITPHPVSQLHIC